MPPKRPAPALVLRDIMFCQDCSLENGEDVVLGKGKIECKTCRNSYDFPAPIPGKRHVGGGAAAVTGAKNLANAADSPATGTKMTRPQYSSLMLWLVNDSNRHIVTGASGSVTNGGAKMSGNARNCCCCCCFHLLIYSTGSKKVTTKAQGFAALAASINRDHPGSNWNADMAGKKFHYLYSKYSSAKIETYKSNWGLSQAELDAGTTIAAKLEKLCAEFECWDKWFGQTQKYNPADVRDSSKIAHVGPAPVTAELHDSKDEDSDSDGPSSVTSTTESHRELIDDSMNGSNAVFDDEEANIPHNSPSFPPVDDDAAGAAAGEPAPDSSAHEQVAAANIPAVLVAPTAALPAKKLTQKQIAADKSKAKADEILATKTAIVAAISNSVSNATSPKGQSFDNLYSATTKEKITGI
jgi:hypothetical protein